MDGFLLLVVIVVLLFFYFIPWLVSASRHHHNQGGIFLLNLLVGWTFIGWLAALIMACGEVKKSSPA